MAEDTNKTDTGDVSKMDDTRTRKTLKLKPIKAEPKKDVLDSVVDPLTMRNTETGPLGAMNDTRTRKTVKLKPVGAGADDVKPVVDPLTQRNTETGPLDPMVDTRTRKTVKLKPLKFGGAEKPPVDVDAGNPPEAAESPSAMLKDTSTRKTLKLKPVKPGEKSLTPASDAASQGEDGAPKMLSDTNTRKTLKLKPIKKEERPTLTPGAVSSAASSQEETSTGEDNLEDTRTRKTVAPAKGTTGLSLDDLKKQAPAEEENLDDTRTRKTAAPLTTDTTGLSVEDLEKKDASEDDTIKIERPKPKPDAMPLPALGAPAAAKTVNNKETVKLRPPSTAAKEQNGEAAKASKETIKLTPKVKAPAPSAPAPAPTPAAEAPDAAEKPKSKLTIGKAPPPKTPVAPKEEATPPEGAGGGLKLKSMAPKTEAPRAAADQEKIKEKKSQKAPSSASGVYTMVAVITIVLVAFSALVTAVQYFNLWDLETIGGEKIELPYIKDMVNIK